MHIQERKKVINIYRDSSERSINEDQILWRYMDIEKFKSMLNRKVLRLTRLDTFDDKAEGFSQCESFFKSLNTTKGYCEERKDEQYFKLRVENIKHKRKNYFASCWTMNEVESYLMWKAYVGHKNQGVAVKTTYKSLKESIQFSSYENLIEDREIKSLFCGQMNYGHEVDLYRFSEHSLAFGKRKEFKEESEFRLVLYYHPNKLQEKSQEIGIDIDTLIKEVYISPFEEEEFYIEIQKLVEGQGLNKDIVKRSSLSISEEDEVFGDYYKDLTNIVMQ